MSALVTATILRWAVDRTGAVPVVSFKESTPITIVVSDTVNNTDTAPVLAAYILKSGEKSQEFLQAARDGLVQVVGMSRIPLTPPAVPPILEEKTEAAPGQGSAERPRGR